MQTPKIVKTSKIDYFEAMSVMSSLMSSLISSRMSRFHFVRLCAVALLIFTGAQCAIELLNLPKTIEAMTSFDLERMTYSLLGIAPEVAVTDDAGTVLEPSFLQKTVGTLFTLFLLMCQLLGAIGILIVNRDSLGRFGRFSVRVWIFFAALGVLSVFIPMVASAVNFMDNSVNQGLTYGADIANESIATEYPMVIEAFELLQTADIPQSYFVRVYGILIVTTLLVYAFLAFMAIKMWRDAKKFRYS